MRLEPAIDLDAARLVAVEAIYREAFAPDLRVPFEDLLQEQFLVGIDADDEPAALVVLRPLGPTGWVYIRYFAAAGRGLGQGTAAFTELLHVLQLAGRTRLIWDVEDPDELEAEGVAIDPGETMIRNRRIAFYRRLGGQLLPVSGYHTPNESGPHRMRLMATELSSALPAAQEPIAGQALRPLILAVYRYRFGLDEADPMVRRTLLETGIL